MHLSPDDLRALDPVALSRRVARALAVPAPPPDLRYRYTHGESHLGAATQRAVWHALAAAEITPRLAEVLADYWDSPGDPSSSGATALLERPDLPRVTVEGLLATIVGLFERSLPAGRWIHVLTHLARAGHLRAADREALLGLWDALPSGEPQASDLSALQRAERRWWLRAALVEDPALDTATLLRFAHLAPQRPDSSVALARVVGHPGASVAVWQAATAHLDTPAWSGRPATRVYQALAESPALARRPAWRRWLQRLDTGGSPAPFERAVLRTLLARPDLAWAREDLEILLRRLLAGPSAPDDEVAATLSGAAPQTLALVGDETWAWALRHVPRARRLAVLRALALRSPAPPSAGPSGPARAAVRRAGASGLGGVR